MESSGSAGYPEQGNLQLDSAETWTANGLLGLALHERRRRHQPVGHPQMVWKGIGSDTAVYASEMQAGA